MHRRVTFPGTSRHRRGRLATFLERVSVLDMRFVLVGDIVVLKILFLYVVLGGTHPSWMGTPDNRPWKKLES